MKHSLTHDRFQGSGDPFDVSAKTTRNSDLRQYSEICIQQTRGTHWLVGLGNKGFV
jgi:hypothetical protein